MLLYLIFKIDRRFVLDVEFVKADDFYGIDDKYHFHLGREPDRLLLLQLLLSIWILMFWLPLMWLLLHKISTVNDVILVVERSSQFDSIVINAHQHIDYISDLDARWIHILELFFTFVWEFAFDCVETVRNVEYITLYLISIWVSVDCSERAIIFFVRNTSLIVSRIFIVSLILLIRCLIISLDMTSKGLFVLW